MKSAIVEPVFNLKGSCMLKNILFLFVMVSPVCGAGENYVSGQITSLKGAGTNPAIRIGDRLVPGNCDGGTYGWLQFKGSTQEQQWLYSTALAMALSKKKVTVYTNNDGTSCKISNIQITSGLN
ncbi:hypothetical protein [Saccharophagus degradans]|uniref:Uncharacterized protein n=1 Tax=Saccharophagus degradans (strain 2-40 / ATCC 43961 / DSM 17024) TaxID=203122 RepID=Q21GA7_SACD2|nr:hypothetical protein [Saccharophagus degradans]ABD82272.1 hypothetical protein Sde_3015 [Saccharophagus degradans 2-40]